MRPTGFDAPATNGAARTRLRRRSLVLRLATTLLATVCAPGLAAAQTGRSGVTDTDPGDPPNEGRGERRAPPGTPVVCGPGNPEGGSDVDPADPPVAGRSRYRRVMQADRDARDPHCPGEEGYWVLREPARGGQGRR